MWLPKFFRNNSANNESFFTRNGEVLLRLQVSFSQGQSNPMLTFTLREIQEATDHFDPSRRLPSGYCGYHWGILDGRKVVVKNWNEIATGEVINDYLAEALITEIVVLSNIRHRNVVKLLGCCLETRVPLLVYESVPNGNLLHHMHLWVGRRAQAPPLSTRLQIAIDVADALNYLHSYASLPVVHKDLHAGAVMLDDGYTAKLTGFSYSIPVPLDKTHVAEDRITRAHGYMDPEYATTGVLTEKVDTYAFGVLLLELLIGVEFPNYLNREGQDLLFEVLYSKEDAQGSPVDYVESCVCNETRREEYLALKEGRLAKILADASPLALGDAAGEADHVRTLAELALRCVRAQTPERPTAKEVVEELRKVRRLALL